MRLSLVIPMKMAALIVFVLLANGCAFYMLRGQGPVTHAVAAKYLPPESPDILQQRQKEIGDLPKLMASISPRPGRVSTGFNSYSHSTFYWPMLAGSYRHVEFFAPAWTPTSGEFPTLFWSGSEHGFLSPLLFSSGEFFIHDFDTGGCIAHEEVVSCLYCLFMKHSVTKPAGEGFSAASTECLVKTKDVRLIPYDHIEACSIAWGLLAWGSKNHDSYFQFLWIPIRVGSD